MEGFIAGRRRQCLRLPDEIFRIGAENTSFAIASPMSVRRLEICLADILFRQACSLNRHGGHLYRLRCLDFIDLL
jgi:hypothetical protein